MKKHNIVEWDNYWIKNNPNLKALKENIKILEDIQEKREEGSPSYNKREDRIEEMKKAILNYKD